MGGERTRKGKYFFLYPACCIALLLGIWGCAALPEWAKTPLAKGERRLARARTLFAKGEYTASLKETHEILRMHPYTLGDKALMQEGLIYACPKNPEHDYQSSLKSFCRLLKEFPRSKERAQAEVWVTLLQEIVDKDIMFQQEIRNKESGISELTKQNSHLEMTLKKETAKVKELETEVQRLKAQAKRSDVEVEKLKEQLLRLKEIDLGIEKKRNQAK
jgi:hypothetical protein